MRFIVLNFLFYYSSKPLKDFNASSIASEGSVASFILFCLLIISTISNGLVGISEIFSSLLGDVSISISSKGDLLNAEYLFEELEIDSSTKSDENSSVIPTNPFEIVEMIRRQNSLNDATKPSDALDDALESFNSLEEK